MNERSEIVNRPDPKTVPLPPKVYNVIEAAIKWYAFQNEDSQLDQQTDTMLYAEAHAVERALIDAIGEL
jgi:hypothetical protein